MLSLNRHKHKTKESYRFDFHPDSIITWLFLFLILLGVDVHIIQISKQTHSPVASPFRGNGKCIPFTCSFCGHQGFLSTGFLWIPFGLHVACVWRSDWKTALLLIKACHFVRSHTFTESDLPMVPRVFQIIYLSGWSWLLSAVGSLSGSNRAEGEKKSYPVNKRRKYLVWQALCFLSYEKLINIQWLKVNTPFFLFTLHPAHSSDCSNFSS